MSPDAQWAVTIDHFAIRLWHVASARMVWSEPIEPVAWATVQFERDGTSILQSGVGTGIVRRPLLVDAGATSAALGPAEPLGPERNALLRYVDDATGDWWVEQPQPMRLSRWPGGRADAAVGVLPITHWARAQLSHDGRFVVAEDEGGSVVVCEVATGRHVAEFPVGGRALVGFSPDDRWLLAGAKDKFQLWETNTWQPGPSWPAFTEGQGSGVFCYSPDGQLVALRHGRSGVELRETTNYRLLMHLEPPATLRNQQIRWSPDGRSIFLFGTGGTLARWHIEAVRQELAQRELDW